MGSPFPVESIVISTWWYFSIKGRCAIACNHDLVPVLLERNSPSGSVRKRLHLDLETEVFEAPDEALGDLVLVATVEVVRSEVFRPSSVPVSGEAEATDRKSVV